MTAALLALVAASNSAAAQSITDGDTLKIGNVIYRIHGIDAPEAKQDCPDGWPAGRLAATHLQSLIAGKSVTCEARTIDRYGRAVAKCFAGGVDLGERMVRDGYAWAFTQYSVEYVAEQERAIKDRLGVHKHACVPAWQWRAARAAKPQNP